jgi:rubredoxin
MGNMTNMVALADVLGTREQLGTPGNRIWRTHFLKPSPGTRAPQAFLVEYAPGRVLRTHFHDVDEFQIVVAGHGTFGKHAIQPLTVHFAREFTPYGPIIAGTEGLSFLTLRARRDSAGPRLLPEQRDELESLAHRRPWQASEHLRLSDDTESVALRPLRSLSDDRGLAAYVVGIAPETRVWLPEARGTGGQYAVAVRGSIRVDTGMLCAPALAFLAADDAPLELTGGAEGAVVIVLNFPDPGAALPAARHRPVMAGDKHWRCTLCGLEYRESEGQPEFGVAAGTRWNDLPPEWRCSDCDAPKSAFVRSVE